MNIKIVNDIEATANQSGNATRVYKKDEIIECKHEWQQKLAQYFLDEGHAIEVKVNAPKETKKVAKKVAKKKKAVKKAK
tara:strand:+ start:135 stop:371 length:237 start_codon:yes stop_codon:yes gene_type:complete